MTFEEHEKYLDECIRKYNEAVCDACNEGLKVKTELCGHTRQIYRVTLSRELR